MPKVKTKVPLFGHLMAAFALFLMLLPAACLNRYQDQDCGSTFCGNLEISYPFRLKNQPPHCGVNGYELECKNNNHTTLVLRQAEFSVHQIYYENRTMRVIDPSLDMDDCNSLPPSPIYFRYVKPSCSSSPNLLCSSSSLSYYYYYYYNHQHQLLYSYSPIVSEGSVIYILNCTKPIKSPLYIDASRTTKSNISSLQTSFIYFLDGNTSSFYFNESCTVEAEVPIMVESISSMSTLGIYRKLSEGFLLSWGDNYHYCDFQGCYINDLFRNQECGSTDHCGSTFCGNMNIRNPFRLKSQPRHCGDYWLELDCENNNITTLTFTRGKFLVQELFYENDTMRVVDEGLALDDCNSLPLSSTYAIKSPFYVSSNRLYVVNCTKPIKSPLYIDASRCTTKSNTSSLQTSFIYFIDGNTLSPDLNESCTVEGEVPIMVKSISGMSTLAIYKKLSEGFLLSWDYIDYQENCQKSSFKVLLSSLRYGFGRYLNSFVYFLFNGRHLNENIRTYTICFGITAGIMGLRTSIGILCLLYLVIYKWRRRHLSVDDKIEEFLQNHNLAPIRYSFKEIKKMSQNFKEKLGEGGYGSVFKGKLRSGQHAAIKLLGKSKGNGQDFINEVASIGRIHHTNVAKLIGFCVEGSKQALVYDFMSNGSLDKIIFSEENNNILGWKKMFDIVVGVARGIDYLHQGCDMQILHFDIKPHNILLDENLNPKVSDFGLAKLYSVDDSIVSLTAARGTIGYIAPELVYKNLGGISYKADVYSFGMLLIEMVGRRRNLNEFAEHRSQIYFPSWIYDRLDQGEDIELGDISDAEKEMVRKMMITAFWCIQLQPTDRPSMNKVLMMFETDMEHLEMPPKPFYQLSLDTSSDAVTITSSIVE